MSRIIDGPMKANSKPKLDNWDFAVIYYLKQGENRNIIPIKEIWAERCMMEIEYVHMWDLVDHFLPIVLSLGEPNNSYYSATRIIHDASPANKWQFCDMGEENNDKSPVVEYYNNIFSVICSSLRLCDPKYLGGFDEYFAQRKANCVVVE